MEDLYSKLGASSTKDDVHAAIQNLDKGIAPGAFCKVLPDFLGGNAQMVNAMHADGAGTKSILAYLQWKETGDIGVWKGIAQDAIVMNLDDLLCIGATSGFLVTSTIGRNKRLIPGEVIKEIIEGTEAFCEQLRTAGVPISFAGGETADVGDLVQTMIVDSCITVRFPKTNLIEASNIKPGNVIVGLSSSGQAAYESEFNSGIASNGLTLARHALLNPFYSTRFPETIDPYLAGRGGYGGKFKLSDTFSDSGRAIGKALLSPTRTFAPIINALFDQLPPGSISGIIHNTGGGHGKVKNFARNVRIEKRVNWEMPELFACIQAQTGISDKEMFQTFNCGIRLEIYCDEQVAGEVMATANRFGVDAFQIGTVLPATGTEVILKSGDQEWRY